MNGSGASATKQMTLTQVTITPHSTQNAAKRAETNEYYNNKQRFGADNVRGAGHTRGF
jgi:hypothetical protein